MNFDTIPKIGYEVRQSVNQTMGKAPTLQSRKRGCALALFRRFALSLRLLGAPRIAPANHLPGSAKATEIADHTKAAPPGSLSLSSCPGNSPRRRVSRVETGYRGREGRVNGVSTDDFTAGVDDDCRNDRPILTAKSRSELQT
jgi:hypothetical protein